MYTAYSFRAKPLSLVVLASMVFLSAIIFIALMVLISYVPSANASEKDGGQQVIDNRALQQLSRGHIHDRWDPARSGRGLWGSGMGLEQSQRMARHWTFMHSGIPKKYHGIANPLAMDQEVIRQGAHLYNQNCASCHGKNGLGDGRAGKGLSPSPALLAFMTQMPMSVDEYLMWSISEGGEKFGSEMPAFNKSLDETSIWHIVSFMRAGFPSDTWRKSE